MLVDIEKDLLRTFPTNVYFNTDHAEGISRLRRLLVAFAYLHPAIGYCQVRLRSLKLTKLMFGRAGNGYGGCDIAAAYDRRGGVLVLFCHHYLAAPRRFCVAGAFLIENSIAHVFFMVV